MTDLSHLDALQARLAREQDRLMKATTENEINFRNREIIACRKEIAAEHKFLGIPTLDEILSDDELMEALLAD
jgi:hypothetical protein